MSPYGIVAPSHRAIRQYYEQVAALHDQRVFNEMSVRSALEPYPLKLTETSSAVLGAAVGAPVQPVQPVEPGLSPAPSARKGGAAVAAVSDRRALQRAGLKAGSTGSLSYRVEDGTRLSFVSARAAGVGDLIEPVRQRTRRESWRARRDALWNG